MTAAITGLTPETEIIPFFSPAAKTQVILMEKKQNVFRVYEHSIEVNSEGVKQITLKRVLKIEDTEPGALQKRIRGTVHTAVSTDLTKNLLLID